MADDERLHGKDNGYGDAWGKASRCFKQLFPTQQVSSCRCVVDSNKRRMLGEGTGVVPGSSFRRGAEQSEVHSKKKTEAEVAATSRQGQKRRRGGN